MLHILSMEETADDDRMLVIPLFSKSNRDPSGLSRTLNPFGSKFHPVKKVCPSKNSRFGVALIRFSTVKELIFKRDEVFEPRQVINEGEQVIPAPHSID